MAQNLVVPRVYRPVAFEGCIEEAVGEAAWDIAGVQLDFNAEGVGSHDAVILGTGEVAWFHKKLGGFLDRYSADEVCNKLGGDMPVSFSTEIVNVSTGDFAVRMERDRSNVLRNYLVGTVHSWQSTSERKLALNSMAFFVGRKDVGLSRDKRFEPKVKLAEFPEGLIPDTFEREINERVGSVILTLGAGIVEPVTLEEFKQPA